MLSFTSIIKRKFRILFSLQWPEKTNLAEKNLICNRVSLICKKDDYKRVNLKCKICNNNDDNISETSIKYFIFKYHYTYKRDNYCFGVATLHCSNFIFTGVA